MGRLSDPGGTGFAGGAIRATPGRGLGRIAPPDRPEVERFAPPCGQQVRRICERPEGSVRVLAGPTQRYFILPRKSSCLQVESQVVWHANCREMPLKANGRVRLDPGLPHLVTESHLLPNIEGVLP